MSTRESVFEETSIFVVEPWNVILLNDDWHTFDEVTLQVQRATGCPHDQALHIALEAHNSGEAVCFTGSRERCELVAQILEEIDLGVRLEQA